MPKTIFRTDDTGTKIIDDLEVNILRVNTNLCLTGLNVGSLLTNTDDGDDCINELTVGPANYLLSVDPSILQPRYTNNIDIDFVTTNELKINGTIEGDLLQVDAGGNIGRTALGSSGTILTSNGTVAEWQPLVLPDPLVLNDLQINNSLVNNGSVTYNNTNNITYTGQNGFLAVIGGQLRFLEGATSSELPDTGVITTGAVFSAVWGSRPTVTDVQFEVVCSFEIKVDGLDQNIRVQLREGFTVVGEMRANSGPSDNFGYKAFSMRTFYQGPPVNFNLFVFPSVTTPTATCNLKNIRFSIRPTL